MFYLIRCGLYIFGIKELVCGKYSAVHEMI